MAKYSNERYEYDVTPDSRVVDTVTEKMPNRGDPMDVRTFKPGRTRTYPLAQVEDPSKVPLRVQGQDQHFEIGLPGARTGQRYPSNADTMNAQFERTAFSDSPAKHAKKRAEVYESVNAVLREDRTRRP